MTRRFGRRSAGGLSVAEAWEVVGGLSRTAKMPCHSWGIPATSCKVGSVLAQRVETVCAGCYALKRAYTWPTVRAAYERRLARAADSRWVDAMSVLVDWQARANRQPYFRWFDSGDLQSVAMLERIAAVARATPEVQHWLPTREFGLVRDYLRRARAPPNLTIRLSATFVDGPPPSAYGLSTSTVYQHRVPDHHACPASAKKPQRCGNCRACWDQTVANVAYRRH